MRAWSLVIITVPFVIVAILGVFIIPKISEGIGAWQDYRIVNQQSIYIPENASTRTRTIYVREFSNWRPPNGAPVFYVPFPDTLCMMGEGVVKETRIIYERTPGACNSLVEGMEHDISRRNHGY